MILVDNIKKSFADNEVLRGVSFSLKEGEIVGLVGPSGGGKSVLLKILGQVLLPDEGNVSYKGTSTCVEGVRSVGFLFQEGALFDSLTVLENVAFPLITSGDIGSPGDCRQAVSHSESFSRAYSILEEVGLEKAALKMPGQISGGMRRRVALARALVGRPDLVLLDDPTGGLDPVAASVIINLIKYLHNSYHPTVIIVSHDIRRLIPNVERLLALFDGKIVTDEKPERLLGHANSRVLHFLSTRYDFAGSGLPAISHESP